HHLQEVYEICQAVTVLRDARHIVTSPVADLPKHRLIEAMTGEQGLLSLADAAGRAFPKEAAVALAVTGLSGDDFPDVSFTVRRGGALGIAGATSSGRVGVAEAVAGLAPYAAGTIRINGRELPKSNVPAALELGVGCVPKSRHQQGLVLSQSVADNTTMTIGRKLGAFGFIVPRRKAGMTRRMIAELGILTEGPGQLVASLSGGN